MSAGAVAAANVIRAARATGIIVTVEPLEFLSLLKRNSNPLVVYATSWFLTTNYQYLTSYKGIAFFTRSSTPLPLPSDAELVHARGIWVPG